MYVVRTVKHAYACDNLIGILSSQIGIVVSPPSKKENTRSSLFTRITISLLTTMTDSRKL
jgi:hypothetical protein